MYFLKSLQYEKLVCPKDESAMEEKKKTKKNMLKKNNNLKKPNILTNEKRLKTKPEIRPEIELGKVENFNFLSGNLSSQRKIKP